MPLSPVDSAVESYFSGAGGSFRRTARIHGVAKSTVHNRKHGRRSIKEARQDKQKLSTGEESALAAYAKRQTQAGNPIEVSALRMMATLILERRVELFSLLLPERLGNHWHENFMKRFPDLAIERTKVMERLRVNGATRPVLEYYFNLFNEMFSLPGLLLENIYNMDEKRVLFGIQNKIRCIIDLTVKNRIRKSAQNRESATIIECISAAGNALSHMMIIVAKTYRNEWYPEGEPGPGQWHFAKSLNGYTDNELGLE
jgi:transposase-like protein